MQVLTMQEIDEVGGGDDIQVVEVHGKRMSWWEKMVYDIEAWLDMGSPSIDDGWITQ